MGPAALRRQDVEAERAGGRDPFPVIWEQPGDDDLTWRYDRTRQSGPVPPLYVDTIGQWQLMAEEGRPRRALRANGYWYVLDEVHRVHRSGHEQMGLADRWFGDWAPTWRRLQERAAQWDWVEAEPSQLMAGWDDAVTTFTAWWRLRHQVETQASQVWGLNRDPVASDPGESFVVTRALWALRTEVVEAGADAGWLRQSILDASEGNLRDTRAATSAGVAWLAKWDQFLARWGQRTEGWGGLGPSWQEDAAVPLRLLQAYLDPARDGLDAEWTARAARASTEAAAPGMESRRAAHDLLAHKVDRIEEQAGYALRRLVKAAGIAMARAGCLSSPDDVVYLTRAELTAGLMGRTADWDSRWAMVVMRRRLDMERWENVDPPDTIGRGGPQWTGRRTVPTHYPSVLPGSPGAPGVVRGPARVVTNLLEAAAALPGEILIARTATAGWAPVFPLAAGLVTQGGHPGVPFALVAEEYGLPTVTGVHAATRLIHNGEWIELDGTRGIVHLLES